MCNINFFLFSSISDANCRFDSGGVRFSVKSRSSYVYSPEVKFKNKVSYYDNVILLAGSSSFQNAVSALEIYSAKRLSRFAFQSRINELTSNTYNFVRGYGLYSFYRFYRSVGHINRVLPSTAHRSFSMVYGRMGGRVNFKTSLSFIIYKLRQKHKPFYAGKSSFDCSNILYIGFANTLLFYYFSFVSNLPTCNRTLLFEDFFRTLNLSAEIAKFYELDFKVGRPSVSSTNFFGRQRFPAKTVLFRLTF